jgi:uncharacterized membrane protein YhiD involved in acid resistance
VQDIVFIFFALSIGMAAGVGLHAIAISGTLIISIIAIILVTFKFGAPRKREYLIQLTYISNPENESRLEAILKKYCRKLRLVNMKTIADDRIEGFYQVTYKNKDKSGELLRELTSFDQVLHANLFFDEDDSDVST